MNLKKYKTGVSPKIFLIRKVKMKIKGRSPDIQTTKMRGDLHLNFQKIKWGINHKILVFLIDEWINTKSQDMETLILQKNIYIRFWLLMKMKKPNEQIENNKIGALAPVSSYF